VATATGVAAAAAVYLTFLKAGDHLIVSEVCYAGVYELATRILPDLGIAITPCDLTDPSAVRAALRPTTRLIHAETPCNPILRLTDLAALSAIAREAGVLLYVDSTLATPVVTRPIDHGFDLVIHSRTRFMNGHEIHYAFSLGHQRSICVHIGTDEIQRSTFWMEGAALSRWKDWAGEGVFRLSVGLEDPADPIADLARVLD
jgi:cystathionine beta-lyase/cystathionine gamma-synthase